MASKVFSFLMAIIVLVAYVNAMAIEKLPDNSPVSDRREITEALSSTSKSVIVAVGEEDDRVKMNAKSALVEKRSVQEDDVKLISDNYIDEEKNDDLETAAGTNVLRPLFVYRQQLAYRERVRKAGRRAAPNV